MSKDARKNRRSFSYQFKVEDEIGYARLLTERQRASAECNIVDVIYESFVVTADQDYLTARLLAHNGLYRAFYWAAAQTVEKYLKAFLLLRGESAKGKSHDVIALYARACALDPTLETLDISPHDRLSICEKSRSYVAVFVTNDFLREVHKFGRPDNRYNAFGVDYNSGHLFALDQFVSGLRARLEVPEIWESMKRVDESLLATLRIDNPWLGIDANDSSDSASRPAPVQLSMNVTKLDFLEAQSTDPSYRLALEWLNKMMQLPVELRRKIDGK